MRKATCTLLLLYISCILFGQIDNGKVKCYRSIQKDIGFVTSFLRLEGKNFIYLRQDCEGYLIGSGTFESNGNRIALQFDTTSCTSISMVETMEVNTVNDSISVNFKVVDIYSGAPLPGVVCIFTGQNMGVVTNEFGAATMRLPQSNPMSYQVSVEYTGYPSRQIVVETSSRNIEIHIELGGVEFLHGAEEIVFARKGRTLQEYLGNLNGHTLRRVKDWDLNDFFTDDYLLEKLSCLRP